MKTLRKLIHILDYQHWLYFNPKQTTSKWVTKRLLVCLIAKVPKSYLLQATGDSIHGRAFSVHGVPFSMRKV